MSWNYSGRWLKVRAEKDKDNNEKTIMFLGSTVTTCEG